MNRKERNLITDVRDTVIELRTDIKWVKESLKEHNKKLNNMDKTLIKVKTGFDNHLKHHEEDIKKLGIYVSIVGIIVATLMSILLKVWLG